MLIVRCGRRLCRCFVQSPPFLVEKHDGDAALRIMIDTHAIQTLKAGVIADGPAWLDGIIGTDDLTALAGLAAFVAAREPVPAAQAST